MFRLRHYNDENELGKKMPNRKEHRVTWKRIKRASISI
jgi:hypothetical protein